MTLGLIIGLMSLSSVVELYLTICILESQFYPAKIILMTIAKRLLKANLVTVVVFV